VQSDPAVVVAERQRAWARAHGNQLIGSKIDRGVPAYTTTLEANLFEPLSDAAHREYGGGDGGELRGKDDAPTKMQAVHSSSALCCNLFHYWRRIGRADVIAKACGLPTNGLRDVSFEQHLPIDEEQFRRAPNLDALFRYDNRIIGVESKFCEPFSSRGHVGLPPAYLSPTCDVFWSRLLALRELGTQLSPDDQTFVHLDAAQLLKHLLGLSRKSEQFALIYLYYAVPGPAGVKHAAEIGTFIAVAQRDGLTISAVTYQDVILNLLRRALSEGERQSHTRYLDYIAERYL
jgi:hypothetical protein